MMQVEIVNATPSPLQAISKAAGVCYGKGDYKESRVRRCIERGHLSVAEHVVLTFEVSGVSRNLTHQLVRHRLASYSQESQRYVKMDPNAEWEADWFEVPETVLAAGFGAEFLDTIQDCAGLYRAMVEAGVPAEDARYIVPSAAHTRIMVTMNVREFFHFLDVRDDDGAQWEIRDLARTMAERAEEMGGEWARLMQMRREIMAKEE